MTVRATDQEVTPKLFFLGFAVDDPMSYFQVARRLDFAVRRYLLPHERSRLYRKLYYHPEHGLDMRKRHGSHYVGLLEVYCHQPEPGRAHLYLDLLHTDLHTVVHTPYHSNFGVLGGALCSLVKDAHDAAREEMGWEDGASYR